MSLYERDELVRELKENVTLVQFIKLDGSVRKMRCTLMKNLLPAVYNEKHLDEEHKKEPNLNTVVVWDIDQKGWRSFHVDNVEYIEILDNY